MRKFLLISCLCCIAVSLKAQLPWPNVNFDTCSFQAVGHRSYPRTYPENTLLALEEAFKRGTKYCETDVSVTADDRYVLFHDTRSIYRTTDGAGRINEINYADLRKLDAGSWKGTQFKGVYVPTLEEAILLAQKYDGHLYLDTKDYRPDLMKLALDNTKADPDRIIPSVSSIVEAQEFRALLPNTPWVWYYGGLYPANIADDQFYTDCINLGCIAFEVSSPDSITADWTQFVNKVHQHGSKVWVFTDNTNERALFLHSIGADGIETDRPWNLNRLINDGAAANFPDSLTTGNWLFEGSLKATGVGSQLRPRHYQNPTLALLPVFNSCAAFGIPLVDGKDKDVMYVPAQDSLNGLLVYTNWVNEDFGTEDPSFSILMDIMIPDSSAGQWIALYQTTVSNETDADLFINPAGSIGVSSVYHGSVQPDTWYRLVYTVDRKNGKLKKYLDGNYIGSNTISGNRWTVFNASPSGENQGFLLFSDNDGETAPVYISALQIRDYVMDSASVKSFGGVSHKGFKTGNADLWNLKVLGNIADSTLLDYDAETYYILVPSGFNLAACNLSFDLSYGATASLTAGSTVNISTGEYWLNVTSEDGLKTKPWRVVVTKQQTTGIAEADPEHEISVYPNPATDHIVVDQQSFLPKSFDITDLAGRRRMQGNVHAPGESIDISILENGMYFIALYDESGSKTVCRFIKEQQ
jgi:glycerophosphoryl diester phosphodiesterase